MAKDAHDVAAVATRAGTSGVPRSTAMVRPRRLAPRWTALAAVALVALLVTVVSPGPSGTPAASGLPLTANWVDLSPASVPPARTSASMAYDTATGDMVLFGGDEVSDGSDTMLSDTWTWDGSTWTEQFPTDSPPARYGASMAYDAATGDMVLFGGISANGDLADTWIWNGINWSEALPTTSPPSRYAASMAYDATTDNVVLFGGLEDRSILQDTWTWNGTNWAHAGGSNKPPARYSASMAYDGSSGDVMLFGGYGGGSGGLNDTWAWNGSTWAALSPAESPSVRYGASLAYDAAIGQMVLFGGYDSGSSDLADMWTFDGSTWAELYPTTTPSARRYAAMDYDPATSDLVLFGGDPGGGAMPASLADTWIWGSEGSFSDTPSAPSVILGAAGSLGSETDMAAVTGNVGAGVPTGTISFYVCGPTAAPTPCTSQADPVGGPVTLAPSTGDTATATSTPAFTPTATGYFCFGADYSGDTDYAPAIDPSDGCFVVDPVMTTSPTASTVTLGNADSDGATVFGTAADGVPTGSVSFYECGETATPTPCTSPAHPVGGPVTVTSAGGDTATATSPSFTPTSTGYWCFSGYYSGGGPYGAGSDTTTDECISVTPVFTTAPNVATVDFGTADTDAAAVTGNATDGVPSGTVTFYVCGPSSVPEPCTSTADPLGSPVPVSVSSGDIATAMSQPFTADAAGEWCFGADYSGGGSYAAATDTATGECFDVVDVAPSFTSAASSSGLSRQPFTFTVTTSGAPTPTITASGLPRWLVLTDNGNGTATLEATKARRGKHSFTLTATNTVSSAVQTFVLTVKK